MAKLNVYEAIRIGEPETNEFALRSKTGHEGSISVRKLSLAETFNLTDSANRLESKYVFGKGPLDEFGELDFDSPHYKPPVPVMAPDGQPVRVGRTNCLIVATLLMSQHGGPDVRYDEYELLVMTTDDELYLSMLEAMAWCGDSAKEDDGSGNSPATLSDSPS